MNTIKISEKTKDRGMEVLAVSENVDHMTTTPVALIPGVSDAKSFINKLKSWGNPLQVSESAFPRFCLFQVAHTIPIWSQNDVIIELGVKLSSDLMIWLSEMPRDLEFPDVLGLLQGLGIDRLVVLSLEC
jgi:hypothetical protein